jgi:hypothetical protein
VEYAKKAYEQTLDFIQNKRQQLKNTEDVSASSAHDTVRNFYGESKIVSWRGVAMLLNNRNLFIESTAYCKPHLWTKSTKCQCQRCVSSKSDISFDGMWAFSLIKHFI